MVPVVPWVPIVVENHRTQKFSEMLAGGRVKTIETFGTIETTGTV
jgi:hypothetical protein